jgi:NAD(P)-dependent dehydrogenase (short-subunit alcohol dehydrogenase family)
MGAELNSLRASGSSLQGRVAVITGAGRGIGREHALLFAAEGASVVVNDLGGSNTGEGNDVGPAQELVEEIRASGGTAVANTENVATWDGAKSLVSQAVDEFGRLDVVVNNAGILRDGFIATLSESDWDAVIAVHLKGHFSVLRHAAAYWKEQSKAGDQPTASVINTASASGTTLPNAGQVNYGSAKAAIAAMTLVAADELERYGVRVNAIAPIARTRLTLATPGMGVLMAEPEDGEVDLFSPANISPLVAYLASEKCPITGRVFAVQGGAISQLAGWHDVDTIETDDIWQIDDIADRLPLLGREPSGATV